MKNKSVIIKKQSEGKVIVKEKIEKIFVGKKWEKINKEKEISFFVGRPSPLGNPFFMKNEEARNEVCDKYQDFFYRKIKENKDKDFFSALKEINDAVKNESVEKVFLGCFCSPKRCHADTIKCWLLENPNFDFDKVLGLEAKDEEKTHQPPINVDWFVPKRKRNSN